MHDALTRAMHDASTRVVRDAFHRFVQDVSTEENFMLLTRIAVSGALLLGINCQVQDDRGPGTNREAVDDAELFIDDTAVATDESMATRDELVAAPLVDERARTSSSDCKWKCECCYFEDDEPVEDECYWKTASEEHEAQDKCMDKCEAHHEPDAVGVDDGRYGVEHGGTHDGSCWPVECWQICDDDDDGH